MEERENVYMQFSALLPPFQAEADHSSDSHEFQSQTSFINDKAPVICREPTLPHGPCRDKSLEDITRGSVLHPRGSSGEGEATEETATEVHKGQESFHHPRISTV